MADNEQKLTVTKDDLVKMGKQLEELLDFYQANSLEVFRVFRNDGDIPLYITFKNDKKKVVAQREFPKKAE